MTKQQILHSACFLSIVSAGALSIKYQALQAILLNAHNRSIHIQYDEYIAPHLRKNLSTTIQDLLTKKTSPSLMFETLKKNIPALTSLQLDYRKAGQLNINLKLDNPLCMIQQKDQTPLILSRKGYYTPYHFYTHDLVQGLPCIMILENNFIQQSQQALYQWVTQLPYNFFERYQIYWNKPTDITILDQEHKNFEYCATCTTCMTPLLEQHLAQLRSLPTQNKNRIKIDIRYKDQFILIPLIHKKGVS